jgi:hypothetical protein
MFFSKTQRLANNREQARKDFIAAVDLAIDQARKAKIHESDISYALEAAAQRLQMRLANKAP